LTLLASCAGARTDAKNLGELAPDVWKQSFPAARRRLLARNGCGRQRGPRKGGRTTFKGIMRTRHEAVERAKTWHRQQRTRKTRFVAKHSEAKAEVALQRLRLATETAAARAEGVLADNDASLKDVRAALCRANNHVAKGRKALQAPATKPIAAPPREGAAPIAKGPLRGGARVRCQAKAQYVFVDPSLRGPSSVADAAARGCEA
jgi:hypothetical protein